MGLQIRYSLIDRTAERDLLPMARSIGLGVTPWSILGAGVLTGKYNRDNPPEEGRAKKGAATVERNLDIAQTVIDIADEIGCSPSQVAIRWVMQQPGTLVPLLGARNLKQIEDNLGVLNITLTEDHLARLHDVSEIDLGFPHNFLNSNAIRDVIFGGTQGQIDM